MFNQHVRNKIIVSIFVAISVTLNSISVLTLIKQRGSKQLRHILLISLAVADLGGMIANLAMEFLTNEHGKTCEISAYLVSTFSLVSISNIVALCVERAVTMKYPMKSIAFFTQKYRWLLFIVPSWLYGILWGTCPLLGWGKYSAESSIQNSRCNLDLKTPEMRVMSFNYSLLAFCYVLPIFSMLGCFVVIKKEMKSMLVIAQKLTGKESVSWKNSMRSECVFTIIVVVILVSFFAAWTPYAICVFYLTKKGTIAPAVLTAASYLGKSSSCFNPMIYVFMYKDFRVALKRLLKFEKSTKV